MSKDLRGAPIKLYRNGHQVTVQPIDADGWLANGYTEEPDNKVSEKEIKDLESGKKKGAA